MRTVLLILCLVASQGLGGWVFAQVPQQDWVSMWALNGRTESQVAKQLKSEYQMTLKMMDRVCKLEELQQQKLEVAAEGDIKRFFRNISRVRAELKEKKLDMNMNNNNNVQEAWNIVQPIATQIQQGLFKENSLFQKVSQSALTQEQRVAFDTELERNRQRRWRVLTRINVATIEKSMPLLEDQREKLLGMMDEIKLKPNKRRWNAHMDAYIGFVKLARLEDEDLKEFLDEHQLDVIQQYRQRYRGWENMLE